VDARPGSIIIPGGHSHVITSTASRPARTAGSCSAKPSRLRERSRPVEDEPAQRLVRLIHAYTRPSGSCDMGAFDSKAQNIAPLP
jgi:hypothetical protein